LCVLEICSFSADQVALDPSTGKLVAGDIGAQTEQIFANISAVLEAAGKSYRRRDEDHRLPSRI